MNEKGFTLVEILTSIVILSIIIVSLLTLFVQSSRINNYSKGMMEATYIAESSMEEINNAVATAVTTEVTTPAFLSKFILPSNYAKKCPEGTCYEKNINANGHYVFVDFIPKGNLITVKVRVFNDSSNSKRLEAHMEMLVSWVK
ncbi:prepilin-type N-terminal cleavage/methylation domain-containing protein [Neobacillus vireti]|uniref:prepilin-type N-terminal cleavage/methylation domain-containing protein n=1 Tax=Neobacillus vireti TaxID=220686 RepID=UPI00300068F2